MLKCLIYANRGASFSPAAITVVGGGGGDISGRQAPALYPHGRKEGLHRSLAPAFPPLFLLLRAFRDALVAIIHRALL